MGLRNYYELLDLPRTASADEIKRVFRREIARYHPDKVQHLGREFQEIAVAKAAELTQAYKALSTPESRAQYDAELDSTSPALSGSPYVRSTSSNSEPLPSPRRPQEEPDGTPQSSAFARERAGATDLIRRATLMRFRHALEGEFGRYEETQLSGFDVVCLPTPAFFSLRLPARVLGRFVDHVDGARIAESWALAARAKKDAQRDLCVFVMGPKLAAAGELATVIAEQRKKPLPAGGKLVMIPVNTLNWNAHVPTDAPAVVKSLLNRLKSA